MKPSLKIVLYLAIAIAIFAITTFVMPMPTGNDADDKQLLVRIIIISTILTGLIIAGIESLPAVMEYKRPKKADIIYLCDHMDQAIELAMEELCLYEDENYTVHKGSDSNGLFIWLLTEDGRLTSQKYYYLYPLMPYINEKLIQHLAGKIKRST